MLTLALPFLPKAEPASLQPVLVSAMMLEWHKKKNTKYTARFRLH